MTGLIGIAVGMVVAGTVRAVVTRAGLYAVDVVAGAV